MSQKLQCIECGRDFERPGVRGPIPTRCGQCKTERRRVKHAEEERRRIDRLAQGIYRCGHCKQEKPGSAFASSQRRDGQWCMDCFRSDYVARSGGLIDKACAVCGEQFQVTRRNERQRFCSRKCKGVEAGRRKGERLRKAKTGRKCVHCAGAIPPEKQISARYCSEECRREHVGADIRRRSMLKRNYGLTPEDFDALLASQGGRCAICRSDDPGAKGMWHVDHCHDAGTVRGLLCSACNTGLGQFKDRPDVLRAAADYLEEHQT